MKDAITNADQLTILHLSDLHFGWDGDESRRAERDLVLNGLLRLIDKIEPEWKPEVVCITGDVGWKGQDADYSEAGEWVRQLLDRLGLSPEALFMCPGNHDSNRGLAKFNKRPSSAAQADKQLVVPIPASFETPFQAYVDFYRGLNVPAYTLGDKESLLVGNRFYRGINFVSYNSAWYSQGKTDQGRLWIGLNLIRSLESKGQLPNPSELDEYPTTIALMHHPKEWFHQEELHVHAKRPSTFEYLALRCHLLLTGHTHDAPSHDEPRRLDKFAEAAWHLSAGATYDGANHFNSCNLIRVEAGRFLLRTFQYDPRSSANDWQPVGQGPVAKPLRGKGEERGRSKVSISEVLKYLDDLAAHMALLPTYYPEHLRASEGGETRFDGIRQTVRVIEDRAAFERWLAEKSERIRATGQGFDRMTYKPVRALPEDEEHDEARSERPALLPPVAWDERAGERFKRAVILGDPGFGKTWLLQYEARRLAVDSARQLREQSISLDELILPIFARLPDVNRKDGTLEDALIALACAKVDAGGSDAFHSFVREKMRSDRCVILLDALDEVTVEPARDGQSIGLQPHYRQSLVRRLADFACQFPQPRLLLTSRIVGYDHAQLSIPNLQELELLAFDVPQTESFVSIWFGDDEQAANQCLAMMRQIPQVRGLGRIPLMLTLICRTYLECKEKQLEFPRHRAELYDLCLRGLLRDWKSEKEEFDISDAYVDAVFELLHTVSFKLFIEGYEQFSESDLRKQIMPWLNSLKRSHELCEHTATSIIAELKRDGVLITAGEHRRAPLRFLHRTFHEYLTAHTLGEIVNDKGWGAQIGLEGSKLTVYQLVERKAWDPAWQEVILLLAGRLRDPLPLLKLLADRRSDDLFRHRLTLAVLCLPEIKLPRKTWRLSRLSRLVDRITTDAFRLWWDHHTRSLSKNAAPVAAISNYVLPALGQVNGRVDGQPLLELICRYLRSEEKDEQAAAVDIIGRIGSVATTADPGFLDRLNRMLQTWDKEVAIHAITSLGSAAATTPIITELVRMLEDEEREELTCVLAGNALGQMPLDIDSGVRAVILDHLAQVIQDPDSSVWYEITHHVRRILGLGHKWDRYLKDVGKGRTKAEALARLLDDLLQQGELYEEADEEREEPEPVPEPTLFFNDFFPITHDELARKLESKDWSERSRAIRAVCKNGAQAASEDILDRLMEILQNPDSGVAVTPVILEQLSFKIENPNWGTEEYTPTILFDALSNRIPLYKAWSVAIVAVSSTEYVRRMVPQGPPDGLNRLAKRLGGKAVFTEEHFRDLNRVAQLVQESRASAFGDEAGGVIFTQLRVLGLLSSLVFERSAAVMAIRILRDAVLERPDIIERLSRMLAHEHYEVWCAAAMVIVGIGREAATQPVLRQVAQMLEDDNWLKRHAATIMLMGIGREFAKEQSILEGVLDRLEQMLADPNWLERYAALVAVASIGSGATRPQIITPIVEMMGDEIPSVRVAAAGALGEMKQSGVYFFVTKDGIKIKGVAELSAV